MTLDAGDISVDDLLVADGKRDVTLEALFPRPLDLLGLVAQMTVQLSRDQALSWKNSNAQLYDSRACLGYFCLAVSGPQHVGALYEGKCSLLYLRLPLDEWFK